MEFEEAPLMRAIDGAEGAVESMIKALVKTELIFPAVSVAISFNLALAVLSEGTLQEVDVDPTVSVVGVPKFVPSIAYANCSEEMVLASLAE